MSEPMIKIGCRLPNGYMLEIGLQATVIGGPQNRHITQVQRRDNYQRIKLRGTHAHTAAMRAQKIQVPSMLAPQPFFTLVPVAFWEAWKKEHKRNGALKNGDIFEVKNEADTKAIVLDVMAKKGPFAPVNPEEVLKVGSDIIEKAKFDDE
jgi:hypothetical protein